MPFARECQNALDIAKAICNMHFPLQVEHKDPKRPSLKWFSRKLKKMTKSRRPGLANERYQNHKADWLGSDGYKEMKRFLDVNADGIPPVTQIVALGCGSLNQLDEEDFWHSARQHSIVWSLFRYFSEVGVKNGESLKCFAQDPAYTNADKWILNNDGIEVLDDPYGFIKIHDKTLVFSINADFPAKEIVSDIAKPAMMIWDWYTTDADSDNARRKAWSYIDSKTGLVPGSLDRSDKTPRARGQVDTYLRYLGGSNAGLPNHRVEDPDPPLEHCAEMLSTDYVAVTFPPGSQRHEDRPLIMFFRNRSANLNTEGNSSSEDKNPKAKEGEKEEPKEGEEERMEEEEETTEEEEKPKKRKKKPKNKKKAKKAKVEPKGVIGNNGREGEHSFWLPWSDCCISMQRFSIVENL